MKLKTIYILGISLLLVSCHGFWMEKYFQNNYTKTLSYLDSNLIDHFPKEISNHSTFITQLSYGQDPNKMIGFSCNEIELIINPPEEIYDSLKTYFKQRSIVKLSPSDSTLLLVFSYCDTLEVDGYIFKNQESPEKQKHAKDNITIARSLPVPLFDIQEYSGNTKSGLNEDFIIFILGANSGEYLDKNHLEECDCLPANWKHGYSKGVAMNDKRKVIIYWTIFW